MKDDIIEILDGSEPIDALNALFSAVFAVAITNGVSEFALSSFFSSHIETQFEIAAAAIAEEGEEAEAQEDEQTED